MAEQRRIYAITDPKEPSKILSLVEAGTPAAALRHHAANTFAVSVATPAQLIAATKSGIEVAKPGEPAATAQAPV